MEERFELFGKHCIKDNSPDARCQLLDAYKACVILNEQDKRIKELEEENLSLQEQSIRDNQNWVEEVEQLKQSQQELVSDALRKLEYSVVDITNGYWHFFNSTGDAYMTSQDLGNCLEEFIKEQIKGVKDD